MLKPTLLDVFSGCGGMTRGFVDAGFEPAMAVEWDLAAASTYAANFGADHMRWGDIAAIPDSDIPSVDVMIGGPPCQGFSGLGLRDVNDPRNALWEQYLRFVQVARPQVFVLENVQRFRSSPQHQLLLDQAAGGMLDGYELRSGVLLAADFGVAQRRPRTIVIGSRIGAIELPQPTHAKDEALGLERWVGTRQRIGELRPKPERTELPDRRSEFFGRLVAGPFTSAEIHVGRKPTQLSLERYDHIPPGGGRHDLPYDLRPPCWQKKERGTTDVMGRMSWERPSLTIRTEFFKPEKGQYLHPEWVTKGDPGNVNRAITHLEAARLQDFPDDFRWCGTKTEIARQIGNAVPVGLARALGEHVLSHLRRTSETKSARTLQL